MSSPEPSIQDMITAGFTAIHGAADKNVDDVRGSDYESLIGPPAVIWSRQAQRDTDLFSDVNFNTATGKVLTDMGLKRYNIARILDTHGAGTLTLTRTVGGAGETIWAGTRFRLTGASPKWYRVTANTVVAGGATTKVVPIEAADIGPGVAVTVSDPTGTMVTIDDELEDQTWKVTALTCADGTLFESAPDYRSRVRKTRFLNRVGQEAQIIAACDSAGAANVILFRSDYAGDAYDGGLNYCYVGNSGFVGTPTLVKACTLALENARVEGDSMQVLPMAAGTVAIAATIYLNDSPRRFNLDRLTAIHTAAINQYMNGTSGTFAYALAGLEGAIIRNTPAVQRVVFTSPTADATVVVGALKNFPAVLTRYTVSSITLTYLAN